jgi:hypothetical protein
MTREPSVFLACPGPAPSTWETCQALMEPLRAGRVYMQPHVSSLLPLAFNTLWADALNKRQELGLTHFAMLHTDVAPQRDWLEVLLAEQQRRGVDVLSCVIPIKDERGLTSTAVLREGQPQVQRLTMHEVMGLSPTFGLAEIGIEGAQGLLVNTGCWVCDFTQPWVEAVWFRFHDGIVRHPDGRFEARNFPEDWNMSLHFLQHKLRVAATRVVSLGHMDGQTAYRNDHAWGTWQTDQGEG